MNESNLNRTPLTAGRFFANLAKAILYLLLFLGCQLAISTLYTFAATIYFTLQSGAPDPSGIWDIMDKTAELVLACTGQISLISGLLTLLLVSVFFLLRHKRLFHEVSLVPAPGRCVVSAGALAPILYAAVSLVFAVLPAEWMEDYIDASAALNDPGVTIFIATVIVAPIVEEVIFRGLIFSRLNRVMPGWLAVVLSAILFGVCHGQAVWMCYAFILGLILGTMTLRTGSIWPSVVTHFIFNLIGQLSSLLPEPAATLVILVFLPLAGLVMTVLFRRGLVDLFFGRRL